VKKNEEAKSWLIGSKKYFQLQNYFGNTNIRVTIFNMNNKSSIWWEDLKNVKGINEKGHMEEVSAQISTLARM